MRILVLSFYYPPDLSAGSFRTAALVDELAKRIPKGSRIEVLTTQPNRYSDYSKKAPVTEESEALLVHRIALPSHRSGMIDQARAFGVYYHAARRFLRDRHYDLIIATTSRLMTGFLGARTAAKVGCPFYLDIRDIFVDTLTDLFKAKVGRFLIPMIELLEQYTVRRADQINLVSPGFVEYFRQKYAIENTDLFTNGIDQEFLSTCDTGVVQGCDVAPEVKVVLYAGNIGAGQGLESILPELAKVSGSEYRFVVVGDGGRRQALQARCEALKVDNIQLESAVSREALMEYYRQADILFLHLNDIPAFEKVLPSKLFEYAALRKPILAGVKGIAADFIRDEISGSWVFTPCDHIEAAEQLREISTVSDLEQFERNRFCEEYSRCNIMQQWVTSILNTAGLDQPDQRMVLENR
ncbi:glycosyltransferase family 4 protein [Motiliproteus sp.]|uniref:glycosyltransferase family 4 protein n=1 Tax=Motiliproteus sp. TaxID=1898955 RepID=UPI003BA910A4